MIRHHRLMWTFTWSLVKSLKRHVFIYLSTLALTAQVLFAGIFHYVEFGVNKGLGSFFDSFYYTVEVMTGVGLGDISAATQLGRLVTIVMMLSGTVIFVCFTGVLAASILQVESEHLKHKAGP